MDPVLLDALTIMLAQALPHLLAAGGKAAGKAVEEVGKEAGGGAVAKAKEAWGKLRGRVEAKPAALEAAEDVADDPEDADARTALRRQLGKILATDEDLAAEIAEIVKAARPEVTTRDIRVRDEGVVASEGGTAARMVAVGGSVQGDVILNINAGPADAVDLWRGLSKRKPSADLTRATDSYLKNLVQRYQYLDFKGMGVSDRVPLRLPLLEMYVPLKARIETPEGETWERLRVAGRTPSEAEMEAMGRRVSAPQPILDLLSRSDGLIILGDPGSGKTTFLKFLALALATGQGEALGLKVRLPVLVPLSAYANALAEEDIRLDRFMARYHAERGMDLPLGELLEQGFQQGGVLLLLDGLDEVRDLGLRNTVIERVFRDCYSDLHTAGNKLVLTSRIIGYREVRPEAAGLAECTLVDFENEEIGAFVEKWTAAVERAATGDAALAAQEAERERQELLEAVDRNLGVRSLAANPLLLTILAVMKRQGVTLPERRPELYQTYVETLLRGWNLVRSLAGRSSRDVDLVETLKVLAPLALWMHETSPGVGLVKEWDLHQKLERIYRERGNADPEKATRGFLEDVREHAALLLDRGGRQFGFIHLTFQEYLAAVALAQKGQQEIGPVVDALAAHVGEPVWHEVSLLTIGYLGIVQKRDEAASAVVEALLAQKPGPPGESVVLAGRAVADAGASGVTPACRQAVVTALLATLRDGGVVARRRAAAGRLLAELEDPRPEVMTVDGVEFCQVPTGKFLMGSEADVCSWSKETPSHEIELSYDFWMARYPVTVSQFREYSEASGNQPEDTEALRRDANTPVRWVSWHEAQAFCAWLTERWRNMDRIKRTWSVALPSETEWEKAARGTDGRIYPWGEEADPERANFGDTGIGEPSSVGCFPSGGSPCGCEEMSGNVWEWTRSLWSKDWYQPTRYPYDPEDGREDPAAPDPRVLRGGGCSSSDGVRCAARYWGDPRGHHENDGFRVVLLPFSPDC
jgi:formylglycine-generating enzyme required for sulfatase activity